jgi:dTDP-4-amino-4,6-dideoxygalactose transaminase
MNIKDKYKRAISDIVEKSTDNVFLFWKGRVALFTILKAMGIKTGDEIILPGFTCVVVPNAIKYLGAKPVYVDIKQDTLNPTYKQIIDSVTSNTKAIIVQNTFGLSSDVDKISEFAKSQGIYTIEDCTHGFGGTYNGKPNGAYCDAAFYSTQWNKPFSTGIGGFAVINNRKLLPLINNLTRNLLLPTWYDELKLFLLNLAYKITIQPGTYWFIRDLYRFLSKYGLVIGSSEGKEITSLNKPKDYFKGAGVIQAWLGLKRINHIDKNIKKRKENALKYTNFLKTHGKYHVNVRLFINHSFLKYPLLVKERVI